MNIVNAGHINGDRVAGFLNYAAKQCIECKLKKKHFELKLGTSVKLYRQTKTTPY